MAAVNDSPLEDAEAATEELDILVLGRTGNGKSCSANSILGKRSFRTSSFTDSETSKIDYDYAEYKDQTLKVVDCPGFGDTKLDSKKHLDSFASTIANAMKVSNGKGYHAFVIVLKYGNRYTEEEQQAVVGIKRAFGEEILQKYCVLVMTQGDTFDGSNETLQDLTFERWCRMQSGEFSELLQQCGERIVLFDNYTKDKDKQIAQRDKLLEMIANLPTGGQRYTNIMFSFASEEVNQNWRRSDSSRIDESVFKSVSIFLDNYEQCKQLEENKENKSEQQLKAWRELMLRCGALLQHLKKQPKKIDFEKYVDTFGEALKTFVSAKESECKTIDEKYQKMIKVGDQLRMVYKTKKAKNIAIGIGVILITLVGVAAAIAIIILCPNARIMFLRTTRVLWPILRRAATPVLALLSCLWAFIMERRREKTQNGSLPVD